MKRKRCLPVIAILLTLLLMGGTIPSACGADAAPGKTAPKGRRDLAVAELESGVTIALNHYSNVHRGTGQNSMTSTALFERAREIVGEYLDVGEDAELIFGTPWGIDTLVGDLKPGTTDTDYTAICSDKETGLRFAVAALAVKKEALPDSPPVVGGGEVDDVCDTTVSWADAPEKFEAGTPNITGVIMFAKALTIMREMDDKDIFRGGSGTRPAMTDTDPYGDARGPELLPKVRASVVGLDTLVPTEEGEVRYINLDNGASTPALEPAMHDAFAALQASDEEARSIIDAARIECAAFFNAPETDYDCLFTLNTTEAINIASVIAATLPEAGSEPVVVTTDLEHNSNELPWRRNNTVVHLPIDYDGFMNAADLEKLLKEYNETKSHGAKRIIVVSVCGASNVLGTFNDLPSLSSLAHRYGAHFHVDAAQLAAHRKVDMAASGIDMLSCSGHKMYAPFGTGCLMVRKELLHTVGADTLRAIRQSGERNLMGIAALRRSMVTLRQIGLDVLERDEAELTARVLRGFDGINKTYGPETVQPFGIQDPAELDEKGPVVCFYVDGIPHNIVAARLAEIRGIGVRDGCFCAQRLLKFLFGSRNEDVARLVREGKTPGLTRVSLGLENTPEDIDAFMQTMAEIIEDPDSRKFIPGEPNCRYCAGKPLVTHEITEKIKDFVQGVVRTVYTDNKGGQ